MKTPREVTNYKFKIFEILNWAVEQGHITEDQETILRDNIEDIEFSLYPREKYKDENGWEHYKTK